MISRIWHGWTTLEKAEAYETLLMSEIFVGIKTQKIDGFKGIHLLRRNIGDEVEFITIMWFDSLEAVSAFAGEDFELAVVPPKARALLSRFDARSQHYEVKAEAK
ncbi:MAG: antibiotic biosynthesis monooxygenase family protein [Candidatus Heimdallarchaeaceae archaeon]|jgi:heme-degrading monooxygenase HmoA